MALTIRKRMAASMGGPAGPGGDRLKIMMGQIDFDASYPSPGGEAMDLSNEFAELHAVIITPCVGYFFEYDMDNSKVIAYESGADGGANDEVADTTDLATAGCTSIPFIAIGY